MSAHSEENQVSVQAIAQAMCVYKESMNQVINDTKHMHELSGSMRELSAEPAK